MKKHKFGAQIKDGKLNLKNKFAFENTVKELPSGEYDLSLEKHYKKASTLQFGYLYGVVYPNSIIALIDAGYEDCKTIEEVDMFWKIQFANKEIVNRETGEVQKIPITKANFKTIDEMAYCDLIRNYCSEYLGYFIPDPDPNYRSKI